ncbi:hypothetical protein L21SP3_01097 [Sedimentisphaera cyanobacteriorum]|uniref:Spore protein YkvP/CgeB glycosyl transferase-like domain-containing protein n=1 Tax=Sedimentisphaera cyanobacteriorum TaxID=1940790 RepID=A0A1Q2HPS9_9BACT|nr:glycosyltransferase [Sedimentisphaera cyanobacteriorum]AQQ09294.1 hypothetical protein L21SP3_01097 [Sedimentisphaera cyanobacteriorum]
MRIVHSDNIMIRRYGLTKVSTGRKLFNGMIRNNWKVIEYSERDIAKFEAPLHIKPLGVPAANKKFIEVCRNWNPDLIIIGHSDLITNNTLDRVKAIMPNVPIAYINVDPPWRERNVKKLHWRKNHVDAMFITSGGDFLRQFCTGRNIVSFIPNAADPCIEDMDNSKKDELEYDLTFCGKGSETDDRYPLIVNLHNDLKDKLKFETFGIYGNPAVWGQEYDSVLSKTKMSLNLNRYEGWKYYSSARISQLMGNGILAFIWDAGQMKDIIPENCAAYFKDEDELKKKIIEFHNDNQMRKDIAGAGRKYYHDNFSGQQIIKYIAETTFGKPYSEDYIWQGEVYK